MWDLGGTFGVKSKTSFHRLAKHGSEEGRWPIGGNSVNLWQMFWSRPVSLVTPTLAGPGGPRTHQVSGLRTHQPATVTARRLLCPPSPPLGSAGSPFLPQLLLIQLALVPDIQARVIRVSRPLAPGLCWHPGSASGKGRLPSSVSPLVTWTPAVLLLPRISQNIF